MLRKDLSIVVSPNGMITITVHGLGDAVELQRLLGESIQMAIADGKTGRANGIPMDVVAPHLPEGGRSAHLRVQVNVSNSEAAVIGYNAKESQ